MPLPTVSAGQQILATDINNHVTQTNTNTTNIATNTSSIGTINTTLSGYNTVPTDANLSSSGGNLHCKTVTLTGGSFTRISKFTGSSINGKVTVNHNLGATPDLVLVNFNLSSTPVAATIGPDYGSLNGSTVDIWASVGANFTGMAIKF